MVVQAVFFRILLLIHLTNFHRMNLHSTFSKIYFFLSTSAAFFLFSLLHVSSVSASPCFPNDPEGTNLGNLCLTYPPSWSPLPNSDTNQPPFIQGIGQPAYYGYPVSPLQPGAIIGRTDGYWTGVQAFNGKTVITDNKGNTIVSP